MRQTVSFIFAPSMYYISISIYADIYIPLSTLLLINGKKSAYKSQVNKQKSRTFNLKRKYILSETLG